MPRYPPSGDDLSMAKCARCGQPIKGAKAYGKGGPFHLWCAAPDLNPQIASLIVDRPKLPAKKPLQHTAVWRDENSGVPFVGYRWYFPDLAARGAQSAKATAETGPTVAGQWLVHPTQAAAQESRLVLLLREHTYSRSWPISSLATVRPSICARTTALSSRPSWFGGGWPGSACRHSTSSRAVLGRTATTRASTASSETSS